MAVKISKERKGKFHSRHFFTVVSTWKLNQAKKKKMHFTKVVSNLEYVTLKC